MHPGLCEIVGVAGIVDEARRGVHHSAGLQCQSVVKELPAIETPPVEIVGTLQFLPGARPVFHGGEVGLMLHDGRPAVLRSLALHGGQEREAYAAEMLCRQVRVEHLAETDTQHVASGDDFGMQAVGGQLLTIG